MLSILYAIAALLAVFALPYAIAFWNVRHTTMQCVKTEPARATDIPEHVKAVFKGTITELKPYGFKLASCYQIALGAEKDGKQWGILLQHSLG